MEQPAIEFITAYFLEKGKFSPTEKGAFISANFVEAALLDSIEFIILISELEAHFNIVFTEADIQSPIFTSIIGMANIAEARIAQQKSSLGSNQ
jgi:acyl carrier protein